MIQMKLSNVIVSPLKAELVTALQYHFYLHEYLPNTVSISPSVREIAPHCWTSVQVRERGPLTPQTLEGNRNFGNLQLQLMESVFRRTQQD